MGKAVRPSDDVVVSRWRSVYRVPAATTAPEQALETYNAWSMRNRDAAQRAADERARQRREAAKRREEEGEIAEVDAYGEALRQEYRDIRVAVGQRLEEGYQHAGGRIGDTGNTTGEVAYAGLVSDEVDSDGKALGALKEFVRRTARETVSGSKLSKMTASRRAARVLALDNEFIDGIRSNRGFIRVKLRGTLSVEALTAHLEAAGVRMPNVLVAPVGDAASVTDAELIWLLRNPVLFGAAGRAKPMKAYRTVARSLALALLPVGAVAEREPTMAGLNPLCPRLFRLVGHDVAYSLGELGEGLAERVSDAELGVPQDHADAVLRAVLREGRSYWKSVVHCAARLVGHHWTECGRNRSVFEAAVLMCAKAFGRVRRMPTAEVERVTAKVAGWMWRTYDPSKQAIRVSGMGPMADEVRGMSVREAQAAGGRYAAGLRRAASVAAIRDALVSFIAEGEAKPTIAMIAERAGRAARTVNSYIADIREELGMARHVLVRRSVGKTVLTAEREFLQNSRQKQTANHLI